MSSSDTEKKMNEFIEKYGYEGYFELFISNYLYELIQYILHSKSRVRADALVTYYYTDSEGKILPPEEMKTFENELKNKCKLRSKVIVKKLTEINFFDKIHAEPFSDPEFASILQNAIHEILSTISEEE